VKIVKPLRSTSPVSLCQLCRTWQKNMVRMKEMLTELTSRLDQADAHRQEQRGQHLNAERSGRSAARRELQLQPG
jgi:hypothetical protein